MNHAKDVKPSEFIDIRIVTKYDPSPDLSYLEQDYKEVKSPVTRNLYLKQDRERKAKYNDGSVDAWFSIGIYAEARATINGVRQTFCSSGLWGIESDAGQSYLHEVAGEQVNEITEILSQVGIAVPENFNVQTADWLER